MARRILNAKKHGDMRYLRLIFIVSGKVCMSPNDVERRIEELSR